MKKETLEQTMKKLKASLDTTVSNLMPIKFTTWKKWTNSQKSSVQSLSRVRLFAWKIDSKHNKENMKCIN